MSDVIVFTLNIYGSPLPSHILVSDIIVSTLIIYRSPLPMRATLLLEEYNRSHKAHLEIRCQYGDSNTIDSIQHFEVK